MRILDLLKRKHGFIDQLKSVVIGIVILAIIIAVCFVILAQLKANTTVSADANATAAVNTLTTAMAQIPGWLPILILVVVGGLVIGAVMYFGRDKV